MDVPKPNYLENHYAKYQNSLEAPSVMAATTLSGDARNPSGEVWTKIGVHVKPFDYAYNPIPKSGNSMVLKNEYFSFLEATEPQSCQDGGFKYRDSLAIHPPFIGVPWPTSFPACRGSKHWRATQEAAEQFMHEIYLHPTEHRLDLPKDLQGKGKEHRMKKESELLETAVTAAIYMFADGSERRVTLMAKIILLIYLHDDVVEFDPSKANETLAGHLIDFWLSCIENHQHQRSDVKFSSVLAYDVLDEDPVLGAALLEGVRAWLIHTRDYPKAGTREFKTLREYLDFRAVDTGQDLLLSGIRFACNVRLSQSELIPLTELIGLYSDHISLTNDLFSFDKESSEHQTDGAILINAVAILQKCLSVGSIRAAKNMVHQMILGIEDRLGQVYQDLCCADGPLNSRQRRFVEGILESLAGHVLYSTIIRRYGGTASLVTSSV